MRSVWHSHPKVTGRGECGPTHWAPGVLRPSGNHTPPHSRRHTTISMQHYARTTCPPLGKGGSPHTSNGHTYTMHTTGKGGTTPHQQRLLARRQGRVGGRLSAMTRHPSLHFKRPRALSSPQSPKFKPPTCEQMQFRIPNPIKGSPGSSRNTHIASYFW